MDKYDNRQSGRTTKMILAACKWAAENNALATIVLHSGSLMPYTGPIIRRIDPAGRWSQAELTYHLSDGGHVQFTTMKNPSVQMKTLTVTGYGPDSVFFDHEAVKLAHNRALKEFHRYG